MFESVFQIIAVSLSAAYGTYLIARKRREPAAWAMAGGLLAGISVEIFDLRSFSHPEALLLMKKGALISESILPFFFLLFSLSFARQQAIRQLSWASRVLLGGAAVFPMVAFSTPMHSFFFSPDFADERVLFLRSSGYFFYVGLIVYLGAALFHLERTLVSLSKSERRRVKLEVVGAGAILAVLLVYYSQALLYRSLDMNLAPVRSTVLALGVVLMGFSRLRRGEALSVRVSRDAAYRSLVVLAIGIYLVGLGLLGEGMRYLDVAVQRSLFVLIAVLSGLAVVLVLLSERLRRRVKVFLHKHFYRTKYDYRREWLRFTRHLSAVRTTDELQQAILQFYCEAFAVQGAVLYLPDEDSGTFRDVARCETGPLDKAFAADSPFARYLAERDWVFNVADSHPAYLGAAEYFCREHGLTLAVPLLFETRLEGIIFLGQRIHPDEALSYEDFDLMKTLAHQATSSLLSLRLSAQLATARELAAIGKVSAFVMHDLKNLVSNIALVVDNARDYIDDPEFQEDMLETLESTVGKMKGLIARLKNMEEKSELDLAPADLLETAEEGVRLAGGNHITVSGDAVLAMMDAAEIQKVVLNLVLNAREACAGKAPVMVAVGRGDMAFVRVSDDGCGMSEEFIRNRLFRPFETTKKKGFGIGLYQCRQVVEAHGGRIEVESREGEGTVFTVLLPLAGNAGFTAEGADVTVAREAC